MLVLFVFYRCYLGALSALLVLAVLVLYWRYMRVILFLFWRVSVLNVWYIGVTGLTLWCYIAASLVCIGITAVVSLLKWRCIGVIVVLYWWYFGTIAAVLLL